MAKRKVVRPKERKTSLQVAFGKAVRAARLKKNLSQEELAALANLHFVRIYNVSDPPEARFFNFD